jgi:hypothetical protein
MAFYTLFFVTVEMHFPTDERILPKAVLADVEKFTYLGNTLSRCVHTDDEINARISKASG